MGFKKSYSLPTGELLLEVFKKKGFDITCKQVSEYVCKKQNRKFSMLSGTAIKAARAKLQGKSVSKDKSVVSKGVLSPQSSAKELVEKLTPRVSPKVKKQYIKLAEVFLEDPNQRRNVIFKKIGLNVGLGAYQYFRKKFLSEVKNGSNENISTPKQRRRNLQFTELTFIEKKSRTEHELIEEILRSINGLLNARLEMVETVHPRVGYEIRHYSR